VKKMYSGIKSSRNGYASVSYPMTDKKVQNEERIGAFRCGGRFFALYPCAVAMGGEAVL